MTYTNQQIAQMAAGQELDNLVAEHVLGFIWIHNKRYGLLRPTNEADDLIEVGHANYGPHPDGNSIGTDDKYSTDIADAWDVVRALNSRGFELEIKELLPHRGRDENLSRVRITKDDYEEETEEWQSMADDTPLAICRAALLAVLQK